MNHPKTTDTLWHDPVVAEIHVARDRLADQYHNDLRAYSLAAEARCRALGLVLEPDQHARDLQQTHVHVSP